MDPEVYAAHCVAWVGASEGSACPEWVMSGDESVVCSLHEDWMGAEARVKFPRYWIQVQAVLLATVRVASFLDALCGSGRI